MAGPLGGMSVMKAFGGVSDTFQLMTLNEGRTVGATGIARSFYTPVIDPTVVPVLSVGTDSQAGVTNPTPGTTQGMLVVANLPNLVAGTEYRYHYDADYSSYLGTGARVGVCSGDFRVTPFARGDRKVVCGAAGTCSESPGSTGPGAVAGLPGASGANGNSGNTGGTQSAGGSGAGGGHAGDTDGVGFGGDCSSSNGAGGGAGYHGGGGNGNYGGVGAGGSSYIDGTFATNPSTSALQSHPYVGDLTVQMKIRNPKSCSVQVAAGAELVFGFHEPLGAKLYNLKDGSSITPTGTTNNLGLRQGRRALASLNDRYWQPAFASGEVAVDMNALGTFDPPAANSGHTGWMCEFFANRTSAAANNGVWNNWYDGATPRITIDHDGTQVLIQMVASDGTTLKASTGFAANLNQWYHILLRLDAGNTWGFYVDGVLKTSWTYTAGKTLSTEKCTWLSASGGVNPVKAMGPFAIHKTDRYTAGYVASVIAAFSA